jgi:hypothetical protein
MAAPVEHAAQSPSMHRVGYPQSPEMKHPPGGTGSHV